MPLRTPTYPYSNSKPHVCARNRHRKTVFYIGIYILKQYIPTRCTTRDYTYPEFYTGIYIYIHRVLYSNILISSHLIRVPHRSKHTHTTSCIGMYPETEIILFDSKKHLAELIIKSLFVTGRGFDCKAAKITRCVSNHIFSGL